MLEILNFFHWHIFQDFHYNSFFVRFESNVLDDFALVLLQVFQEWIFDLGVLGNIQFVLLAIELKATFLVQLNVVVR